MKKKPVKSERCTVDNWPALKIRGYREGGQMIERETAEAWVLGVHKDSDRFWAMNLTRQTKGLLSVEQLLKNFDAIQAEAATA